MAQRPKCMHCEAAIAEDPGYPDVWVHLWSHTEKCLKVTNRKPLGTTAKPRPEK